MAELARRVIDRLKCFQFLAKDEKIGITVPQVLVSWGKKLRLAKCTTRLPNVPNLLTETQIYGCVSRFGPEVARQIRHPGKQRDGCG